MEFNLLIMQLTQPPGSSVLNHKAAKAIHQLQNLATQNHDLIMSQHARLLRLEEEIQYVKDNYTVPRDTTNTTPVTEKLPEDSIPVEA